MTIPCISELFDIEKTILKDFFEKVRYPYGLTVRIGEMISSLGDRLSDYHILKEGVYLGEDVTVAEDATILAPCIIGKGSVVRTGAYIRGSTVIGEGCVIGNSTEVKSSILFDGVKLPHYSYVGDSILGAGVHFGAGAITTNCRLDGKNVLIGTGEVRIPSGRRKFGAVIGDFAEVGAGAVLSPGVVIGKNAIIYPLTRVSGVIGEGEIVKYSTF